MDEPIKNPRLDAALRAFEAQGAIDRARLTAAARPTRLDAYKARGLVVRLFVQREELNDANDDMEKIRTRGEAADWRNEAARMHARGKDDDARQLTAQIAPDYASEGFALMGTELDEFERLDADSQRRKRSELIEQTRAHRIAELEHLPRLEAEQSQRHAQFIDGCTEFNQLVTPLLAAARACDFATTNAIAALLHLTQTWVNNWSFKGPVGVLEAGQYALDDLIDRLPVSDASPASSPTAATTVGASKPVPTAGSIDAATSTTEGASCSAQSDVTLSDEAWVTVDTLAKFFECDMSPLRHKLDRWRKNNRDGWKEATDRKPREHRYLYQIRAVRSIIEARRD